MVPELEPDLPPPPRRERRGGDGERGEGEPLSPPPLRDRRGGEGGQVPVSAHRPHVAEEWKGKEGAIHVGEGKRLGRASKEDLEGWEQEKEKGL